MDKHYLKYVHTEGGMTKCGGSKGSCVDQITDKGEGVKNPEKPKNFADIIYGRPLTCLPLEAFSKGATEY